MPRKAVLLGQLGVWIGLILVAGLAQADEPSLAIRLVGGESAVYPVSELEQVFFEDSLVIVDGLGGEDTYGTDQIVRMEFLWDPQNSSSPEEAAQVIKAIRLFQNQPNPFSPKTEITFDLPQAGKADLQIYHANGRLIRTLVSDTRTAGRHTVLWDGQDDSGEKVAGGVYFYQLRAPGVEESRRMVMLH